MREPARVLDTRVGTRAGACPATTVECTTLSSGGSRTVQIAGQGPVPAGVGSVLATVTVFGAVSVGVLQAYPGGGSAPDGLSMVFNGGVPVTQLIALPLNADGQVTLTSWFAAVDVTVDVVGWNVAATGTWAYSYSPDGLRVSKTSPAGSGIGATAFTWDRASGLPMLLAQTQAGVGVTYFIYGPGGLPVEQINPDGTTVWLHHDQIGSTRTATDASGAVVATWSYDPYGNPTARTGTIDVPLGYTGQYTDSETGNQYLRARYYNPTTGTFLSRDPLNAATRSAYGYVGGDPVNATDPSGLAIGIPDWVPVVGGGCIAVGSTDYKDDEGNTQSCDNSQNQDGAAQFYAGMANGLTGGGADLLFRATGKAQYVDAGSGYYIGGNYFGQVVATPTLIRSKGLQMVNSGLSTLSSLSYCQQAGLTAGCAISLGSSSASAYFGYRVGSLTALGRPIGVWMSGTYSTLAGILGQAGPMVDEQGKC